MITPYNLTTLIVVVNKTLRDYYISCLHRINYYFIVIAIYDFIPLYYQILIHFKLLTIMTYTNSFSN